MLGRDVQLWMLEGETPSPALPARGREKTKVESGKGEGDEPALKVAKGEGDKRG